MYGNTRRKWLETVRRIRKGYETILIYTENLSLMGTGIKVTAKNRRALMDFLDQEEVNEESWDETEMSKEEIIYNYTLDLLIRELNEVRALRGKLQSPR